MQEVLADGEPREAAQVEDPARQNAQLVAARVQLAQMAAESSTIKVES